jgi:hypothetical protein
MNDDGPPLKDFHFYQLCQMVLEGGAKARFPDRFHRQIAQRMVDLLKTVPRSRGRPQSHTSEAGSLVERFIEHDIPQAEARRMAAEEFPLSLRSVARAHQKFLKENGGERYRAYRASLRARLK